MSNQKNLVPKWLEDLQENSWELELLISGGAIFSLFTLSDLFLDFVFTLKMTALLPGTDLFVIVGMLGIKMLTLGFVSHLILRAFWIGLVCINYVFPEGIAYKKVKSNSLSTVQENEEDGSLKKEIINIDQACGLVMFISIISTGVIAGIIFLIICLITLPSLLLEIPFVYINIVAVSVLIYIADLLGYGFLRRIPVLSQVLFPLFKLFDLLTFRALYQKALTLYSSNVNKLRSALGFTLLIVVSFFFAYHSLYRTLRWPNLVDGRKHRWSMAPPENWMSHAFYMDELKSENGKYPGPAIQSAIVSANFLKVFVPYNIRYDLDIADDAVLSEYVELSINDSTYHNLDWYNYRAKENDQLGVMALVDIKHLERGNYTLVISKKANKEFRAVIPFWRDL